jgi:hypothetical protein
VNQIGQRFGLSSKPADGVFCSEDGLFVGDVPLLKQVRGTAGPGRWRARSVRDLNRELSVRYGLPIEIDRRTDALSAIACALNRGDVIHARIAALHLRIPDPPPLAKSRQTTDDIIDLACRLRASGLLKADWDPVKHPRWPAGSSGGTGGEFAPIGVVSSDSANSNARAIPVQSPTITAPFDFALPRTFQLPSEIAPAVPSFPTINPRAAPKNPYPDRPECEEEWAEAIQYCGKLELRGLLGKGDYRGMGRTFRECVMGQVSEACGGNSTA